MAGASALARSLARVRPMRRRSCPILRYLLVAVCLETEEETYEATGVLWLQAAHEDGLQGRRGKGRPALPQDPAVRKHQPRQTLWSAEEVLRGANRSAVVELAPRPFLDLNNQDGIHAVPLCSYDAKPRAGLRRHRHLRLGPPARTSSSGPSSPLDSADQFRWAEACGNAPGGADVCPAKEEEWIFLLLRGYSMSR